MDLETVATALAPSGLICRGAFRPTADDGVPATGGVSATLVIIGNAGPDMWRAFSGSPEGQDCARHRHPLDDWTRRVVGDAAAELGAMALYPFGGPPYHPFQRWAMKADAVWPSPIGPLIHQEFGLWHAYRAAFVFEADFAPAENERGPSPCDDCAEKPCLATCPVGAFSRHGYDVRACAGHILSEQGEECARNGCLARHACPLGTAYAYVPEQAAFHMEKFIRSRREGRMF